MTIGFDIVEGVYVGLMEEEANLHKSVFCWVSNWCILVLFTQVKPKPLLLKLLKLAGAEKDTFTMKEVRICDY